MAFAERSPTVITWSISLFNSVQASGSREFTAIFPTTQSLWDLNLLSYLPDVPCLRHSCGLWEKLGLRMTVLSPAST